MSPDGQNPGGQSPVGDGRPASEQVPPGTVRRVVTICNQRGLHARAAARFVKTAAQFEADVWVRKNGTAVSGRSIMGLMMLAAASGTCIELTATGRDAETAVATLADLIECKFNED
jgi:phosphocarrier protein HPr